MNHGLSDQVRAVALNRFIHPAVRSGKEQFSVAVRDLMQYLQADGFPERNWPQVCTAIQAQKFLRANGLEIESVEGPPKKQSPTVVVRYRVASHARVPETEAVRSGSAAGAPTEETPSERAFRLTERLRGLLKNEIAAFGGSEPFMHWVRGHDEDEDAA
jgi:hypothetical protein